MNSDDGSAQVDQVERSTRLARALLLVGPVLACMLTDRLFRRPMPG